jgi:hypothetical protein
VADKTLEGKRVNFWFRMTQRWVLVPHRIKKGAKWTKRGRNGEWKGKAKDFIAHPKRE